MAAKKKTASKGKAPKHNGNGRAKAVKKAARDYSHRLDVRKKLSGRSKK